MINASVTDSLSGRGVLSVYEIEAIAKGFELGKVEAVEFIPSGLMNLNWRFWSDRGSVAVKRLTDTSAGDVRSNLAVMRELNVRNLPVCMPLTARAEESALSMDGSLYCVVPWVEGRQPRGIDLTITEARILGATLADLHTGLQELGSPLLPTAEQRPKSKVANPCTAIAEADRFIELATQANSQSAFEEKVVVHLEARKLLLEEYASVRPDSDEPSGPYGWTHGDFQHLNVIWSGERVAAVIDWDRIRVRILGEEVARSATLLFGHDDGRLDLERVATFVGGYRSRIALSSEDMIDAVDRLWWKRMCDFWHLEFHFDRDDHTCDHLFDSACRFLGWWTQRRDEVQAAFTGSR